MNHKAKSIRPFIGSKNYEISRNFYRDAGFEEVVLFPTMCLFKTSSIAFYLQDAYVKDWIDNTMIFVEVDDVDSYWKEMSALNLAAKYAGVKLSSIQNNDWGREFFLHDPAGVLWHFGQFSNR
jgi:uncharacterized glyoxalase superfamily protein PhnB